jgi:hypothetical protein
MKAIKTREVRNITILNKKSFDNTSCLVDISNMDLCSFLNKVIDNSFVENLIIKDSIDDNGYYSLIYQMNSDDFKTDIHYNIADNVFMRYGGGIDSNYIPFMCLLDSIAYRRYIRKLKLSESEEDLNVDKACEMRLYLEGFRIPLIIMK